MTNYYSLISPLCEFATVPINEYIELLEFKLSDLKEAQEKDSSWNYEIEELEKQIKKIKDFHKMVNE